jgi:hypothetical protein
MNLRNVLRTYALLRQLSDDESALLTTLRGMSEGERELLVESLAPTKPVVKKRKSASKSPRASSLAQQIKSAGLPKGDGEKESKEPICAACGNVEDYADHSQPSPHYHPFVSPSSVRNAAGRSSSKNGGSEESTVSSETDADAVLVAAGE